MSTDSSIEDLLNTQVPLKEVPIAHDRKALFIKKLKLCCITFDFTIDNLDQKHQSAKQKKRTYLLELTEYISRSDHQWSDDFVPVLLEMIAANLFRSLPAPEYDDFDPEEDEPNYDPSWPHLQLVYELFYRFSKTADSKMIRRYVDKRILLNVIDLFNSEDPRERDYVKSVLHRLYGRCMAFRSFLRKSINNVLYAAIYSNVHHNGISELLEICGSIINGFMLPLLTDNISWFYNVFIPLHKVSFLSQFHPQLVYCITQFIEKDYRLASSVIGGMLKFWPTLSCVKEILYLDELEEVLELTENSQLEKMIEPVFHRISRSVCSKHFQVAERAMYLWNNHVIAEFTSDHRRQILSIVYPALKKNYSTHWNTSICKLTLAILEIFKEMDEELYEEVARNYKNDRQSSRTKREERESKWKAIEQMSNKQLMNMQ